MSEIKKTIRTDHSATEMKLYIDQNILSRKELTALFDSAIWAGNTLNVASKLGSGTVVLHDNLVEITINLTFFGRFAKKQIESGLDVSFKQLEGKS